MKKKTSYIYHHTIKNSGLNTHQNNVRQPNEKNFGGYLTHQFLYYVEIWKYIVLYNV